LYQAIDLIFEIVLLFLVKIGQVRRILLSEPEEKHYGERGAPYRVKGPLFVGLLCRSGQRVLDKVTDFLWVWGGKKEGKGCGQPKKII
jgi:hypothetical protein